ncbi:hypothetical protein N599_35840 [Saccharopolyspora erythraea D]|nr:hypothetical protein N599_35840 [Saccharopolyspora erythraea D]
MRSVVLAQEAWAAMRARRLRWAGVMPWWLDIVADPESVLDLLGRASWLGIRRR